MERKPSVAALAMIKFHGSATIKSPPTWWSFLQSATHCEHKCTANQLIYCPSQCKRPSWSRLVPTPTLILVFHASRSGFTTDLFFGFPICVFEWLMRWIWSRMCRFGGLCLDLVGCEITEKFLILQQNKHQKWFSEHFQVHLQTPKTKMFSVENILHLKFFF